MNTHNILRFIDKAIEKTKSKELSWNTISTTFNIKPIPEDRSILRNSVYELSRRLSYYADYKTGQLLFLVYRIATEGNYNFESFFTPTPPSNCVLELRIQDSKSQYSIEISNTNDDISNSPSLMRLYNLIEQSSSLNALIDDFLNS